MNYFIGLLLSLCSLISMAAGVCDTKSAAVRRMLTEGYSTACQSQANLQNVDSLGRGIELKQTEIDGFKDGDFYGLGRVKDLTLDMNKNQPAVINNLPLDIFKGLDSLETLVIDIPVISTLDPKVFAQLPKLKTLIIRFHDAVPDGFFKSVFKKCCVEQVCAV